jgi:hypothetical protein
LGLLGQADGDSLGIHSQEARNLAGQGDSEEKLDSVDTLLEAIEDSVPAGTTAEGSSVDGEGHSLAVSSLEGLEERCSLDLDNLMVVEPFVQILAEVADTD